MGKPLPRHDADYAHHMHELNNRLGVAISSLTYMSMRSTNDLDKRLLETALMGVRHAQEYMQEALKPDSTPQSKTPSPIL